MIVFFLLLFEKRKDIFLTEVKLSVSFSTGVSSPNIPTRRVISDTRLEPETGLVYDVKGVVVVVMVV